jgi:hypothetical protein
MLPKIVADIDLASGKITMEAKTSDFLWLISNFVISEIEKSKRKLI